MKTDHNSATGAPQAREGASFYAHTGPIGAWEPLSKHLRAVAGRAAEFASAFEASEEARSAGLLHDLGKYGEVFQRRLRGLETAVDHWWAGAWQALSAYKASGVAICLAIQGHHIGLQRYDPNDLRRHLDPARLRTHHPLGLRLSEASGDIGLLLKRLRAEGIELPTLTRSLCDPLASDSEAAFMLDARMLFSALADADYLETERHFDGRSRPTPPALDPGRLRARLSEHVAELARSSPASPEVKALRGELREECLAAAGREPGLFTLTAPTGAGKTLSMLEFALRHAQCHDMRRIVTVIPYLSIIDQTVRTYRQALHLPVESSALVEDHSMAIAERHEPSPEAHDGERGDEAWRIQRQTAENWDSPLIVTTSVQMLESLFSSRPAACRKLHRLARSVILFDEVQTLPARIAVPTLATISRLAQRYCCTVVFATATQPAFPHLDKAVRRFCTAGWSPREIVPRPERLFAAARRTSVRWPAPGQTLSWDELADRIACLAEPRRALVIVNLKRHAVDLFERLQSSHVTGLFHLSTSMCPAHRSAALTEIDARLHPKSNEPCVLIATQCVEAGVDLDFPRVFRALGPLEAVAQAAGRCNRNARLLEGLVETFVPADEPLYPSKSYEQAARVTALLMQRHGGQLDIDDPKLFGEYYRELYSLSDVEKQSPQLQEAVRNRDFAGVAHLYRVIEKDAINLLVPYDPAAFEELSAHARTHGLDRDWINRARPHAVSVFRQAASSPEQGFFEPVPIRPGHLGTDWFLLTNPKHYDREKIGLRLPKQADALII